MAARRGMGLLLAAFAVAELGAAAWLLAVGPFAVRFGPVSMVGGQATRPFWFGIMMAGLAIWLIEPSVSAAARARFGAIASAAACAAVALGIVPLVAPIFLPDFTLGHDGGVHQTYAFLMNRALRQGQFPVRWVEGTRAGVGQPLFNYYQVGFYYVVALVHACGPGLSLALKLTVAGVWSAGIAFMFLLCRPLGLLPAALAATVFAWSPYLLLDVYVRSAFPELTAIAFSVGLLWSIDRVLRTGRPGFVCTLALMTGLLLISHLPTALIVAPVAVGLVIGTVAGQRRGARLASVAVAGAVLGAGLAAFYVVPAIGELDGVKIRRLTSAYFDYHLHFVPTAWWFDRTWSYGSSGVGVIDHLSLQIGIMQGIVLAAAAVMLCAVLVRRRSAGQMLPLAGWLAVVGAAMFMMTAASVRIWEHIGPLAFIQFPWRILLLVTIACGILAATVLSAIRSRVTQAAVVLCVVSVQGYVTRDYRSITWTHERASIGIDDPAWPSTESARRWAFREPGYDPVSVTNDVSGPSVSERWSVVEGRVGVLATAETDASLRLTLRAEQPATLVINSPFLPGWTVAVDGRTMSPVVRVGSGYMEFAVPAGLHRVEAVFGKSRVRAAAEMVTLVSAALWFFLLSWTAWSRLSAKYRWTK